MFSNCIKRLGHQKRKRKKEAKQQQINKEKPRENKQIKNRNNSTHSMNHYPRNGSKGDLEFSTR